jgi:Tfp pilus assembly protein PilN
MAQQINLYSPILLQPKRYFSALAMLQALAALLLGLLALGAWVETATAQQRRELATTTTAQSADRQRLQAELGAKPAAPKDTSALEQELVQTRQAVQDRQRLLSDLATPGSTNSRAALLRVIAQTAPEKLWLTEVRLAEGRLELAGISLQPEQLRPWFALLLSQPAMQGLALRTVVVEAAESDTGTAQGRDPRWSFRMVAQARPDAQTDRLAADRPAAPQATRVPAP